MAGAPMHAGGRLVEDEAYDVPGAEGAWRVVVDYRIQPEGGGDIVPDSFELVSE